MYTIIQDFIYSKIEVNTELSNVYILMTLNPIKNKNNTFTTTMSGTAAIKTRQK